MKLLGMIRKKEDLENFTLIEHIEVKNASGTVTSLV